MPAKKVLVAEDDADIQFLITYSLQYAGYKVVEASNGGEAVDLAQKEQPDLIILDVRMPKVGGLEACVQLKSQTLTREIPVVFLSARGQDAEVKRGLALGAEAYVLKPFAPEELLRRVDDILKRTASQQGQEIPVPDPSVQASGPAGTGTQRADEWCSS
jgi:DNA-binding response OmpR family regulator